MTAQGPFGTGNFSVEIGPGEPANLKTGDPGDPAIGPGFAVVTLPDFAIGHDAAGLLVLQRAATGKRDLYAWWDRARSGTGNAKRDVRVRMMSGDWQQIVMAWHFAGARPVLWQTASLDANAPGMMLETLSLAFDRMDLDYPGDPRPNMPQPPVPPRPFIPGVLR